MNALHPRPLPLRLPAAFYALESGARPLLLNEAKELFESGRAVFVDARGTKEFERGQIEGALNLPFDRWEEFYHAVEPWIDRRRIVLYAQEDRISLADDLAGALASRGHRDSVCLYLGGFEEWRRAGLPIGTGPDPNIEGVEEETW